VRGRICAVVAVDVHARHHAGINETQPALVWP
jgi:hypothetical protein